MLKSRVFIVSCTIVVIVLIVLNLIVMQGNKALVKEKSGTGQASIGGAFTLVNQDGKTVTDADFRGKLMLVYFGFSNCPAICPVDMGVFSAVLTELGDDASKVAALFISVDPERDTPARLKTFLKSFHPGIVGLTGTKEQVEAAKQAYRVYAKKVEMEGMESADYMMDHSTFTYLMDREGKYLAHFSHDSDPQVMAAKIKSILEH